ncbi:MAG: GntR family transcriptional regulator [Pseudooceanicola nanhaiensis]
MPAFKRSSQQTHVDLARQVTNVALERGLKLGDHLPEQAMSDACGVSRTPIRSAFKLLESKDILEWRPEQGYFLALEAPDAISAALSELEEMEDSLSDRILADRAKRRIGEIQSVSALARRYGASRTTVLFALKVLSRDGIVTQLPGRAWAFQPMIDSPQAHSESFEMRLSLEPLALGSPGFALDSKRAGLVRTRTEEFLALDETRLTAGKFHRLDVDFHSLVAEGSGNRFVRSTLLGHIRLRVASRGGQTVPAFRMLQSLREHIDILDSLERKQYALAADQMRVHLRRSDIRRPDAANRGLSPLAIGSRS